MKLIKRIKSLLPLIVENRGNYKFFILGNKQAYAQILSKKEKRLLDDFVKTGGFKKSYSQDGEDMLLMSLYEEMPSYKGFYVDIGAHDPIRFSNTQYFYENGWRGINIDATPNSMDRFKKLRPNDINIECAISNKENQLVYYCFEESALNSFNIELSEQRIKEGWMLEKKEIIHTQTINSILKKNVPQNQKIDFIDIDVEGMELDILASFDFEQFGPKYFLIEDLYKKHSDMSEMEHSELNDFMKKKNYYPILKCKRTIVYSKQR